MPSPLNTTRSRQLQLVVFKHDLISNVCNFCRAALRRYRVKPGQALPHLRDDRANRSCVRSPVSGQGDAAMNRRATLTFLVVCASSVLAGCDLLDPKGLEKDRRDELEKARL